jgi:histidinol-phosphate aminotransferase
MIPVVPHISKMSPYALAQLSTPPGQRLLSLSQNESLRPPSPKVAEAISEAVATSHLYPDPDWSQLREALAARYAVPASAILCGNGSMELIACLTQAYADVDNAVLAPAHAYPFFRTATQIVCARFDTAPESDLQVSVEALLAAVRPDTRLIFVANPGNPTGTRISAAALRLLRGALREDILLVIDEAYGEFADGLGEATFDLATRGDTVVLRSFSKAYGLAGLRIGWGVFPPDIAREIRKVMNPNNISAVGQAAARAAVQDHRFMQATVQQTAQLRDRFTTRLQRAGFRVPRSFTNFVLIDFGTAERADHADRALKAQGIVLRAQGGVGLPSCLRATIGTADTMVHAAEALEHWAKETPI